MSQPKQPKGPWPSKFHDHLDVCKQCREHPFGLCPIGAAALQQEATETLNPSANPEKLKIES
jgi:hypothetical protein